MVGPYDMHEQDVPAHSAPPRSASLPFHSHEAPHRIAAARESMHLLRHFVPLIPRISAHICCTPPSTSLARNLGRQYPQPAAPMLSQNVRPNVRTHLPTPPRTPPNPTVSRALNPSPHNDSRTCHRRRGLETQGCGVGLC